MPLYASGDAQPSLPADDSAWLAPGAVLVGDVRLGAETSVWYGAVVRADNTPIVIGARTNIQEHAVLHSDPGVPLAIGEGCTIGHRAMLHGCTIGDNSLIVGVPARVVRELDAAAIEGLRASARSYVAKSRPGARPIDLPASRRP